MEPAVLAMVVVAQLSPGLPLAVTQYAFYVEAAERYRAYMGPSKD
jgi:hypothetical protein